MKIAGLQLNVKVKISDTSYMAITGYFSLAFQCFEEDESTWWRLFQKCVVRSKLDIYVCITITLSIPLLCSQYFGTDKV